MDESLHMRLQSVVAQAPQRTALLSTEHALISYDSLWQQIETIRLQLRRAGIGRNDRVALVMPDGLEAAIAFLGTACAATAAPLNPNYRPDEFRFFLTDLDAKALLVPTRFSNPARQVAADIGCMVLNADWKQESLLLSTSHSCIISPDDDPAAADDIALILHTSGTTSRPKMALLTHNNICASASNIEQTLSLVPSDRCLSIMPLYHIHGLMAGLVASLIAGGSVVCTPGFDASAFLSWLCRFQPTWYTAVPTLHQAILELARHHPDKAAGTGLRFVRSSSASLSPVVMAALEETFRIPVIESYGMTEAASQMTSNPLPPAKRTPGSVGLPAGPEVMISESTILDVQQNDSVDSDVGTIGEILIRGANVIQGYANNPAANRTAFSDGWFRTGDLGYFDADGYLFITGRLKEMINRGGETIAPREVDDVFMMHPAVSQAVTFGAPHRTLGEDVVTAVILRKDGAATEQELRQFAFDRLAAYKIPTQVLLVNKIPTGASGKLQRIGLAEKFAHLRRADHVAPATPVEKVLARIWADVLGQAHIGRHDNFFALGGDSLTAAQVVARIAESQHIDLSLASIFHEPVLADQALAIAAMLLAEHGDLADQSLSSRRV